MVKQYSLLLFCVCPWLFAQSPTPPLKIGPTLQVKAFEGRVVVVKDNELQSVSNATVSEFAIGGGQPIAVTTTNQNGIFRLPPPIDLSPKSLVINDGKGHIRIIHVQLSPKGMRLRVHLYSIN